MTRAARGIGRAIARELGAAGCDVVVNYYEAIRRNTRAYNAALERLILRHPEQWWWVHRRWKVASAAPAPGVCGASGAE